jgi:hypothetical protein
LGDLLAVRSTSPPSCCEESWSSLITDHTATGHSRTCKYHGQVTHWMQCQLLTEYFTCIFKHCVVYEQIFKNKTVL